MKDFFFKLEVHVKSPTGACLHWYEGLGLGADKNDIITEKNNNKRTHINKLQLSLRKQEVNQMPLTRWQSASDEPQHHPGHIWRY